MSSIGKIINGEYVEFANNGGTGGGRVEYDFAGTLEELEQKIQSGKVKEGDKAWITDDPEDEVNVTGDFAPNRVIVSDAEGNPIESDVTVEQLNALVSQLQSVQEQLETVSARMSNNDMTDPSEFYQNAELGLTALKTSEQSTGLPEEISGGG